MWNEHRESTRGRDLDITGLSYAMLEERGPQQWPLPEGASGGRVRLYEDGVFATPDGKARFVDAPLAPLAEPRDARFPFSLITGRLRDQWHGGSRTGTKPCPGDMGAAMGADRVRFVNSRRQRNSRLECSACRRATSDTDPPGASISARIASFCSRRHRRRVLAITSNFGEVLSPDIVPSYLQLPSVGTSRRYPFHPHKAAFPGRLQFGRGP